MRWRMQPMWHSVHDRPIGAGFYGRGFLFDVLDAVESGGVAFVYDWARAEFALRFARRLLARRKLDYPLVIHVFRRNAARGGTTFSERLAKMILREAKA